MGIPARRNDFGEFDFRSDEVITTTSYRVNGTSFFSQAASSYPEHLCRRFYHTSNPLTVVNGIPGYRRPSNYERAVMDVVPVKGQWEYRYFPVPTSQTGVTHQVVEGPATGGNFDVCWDGRFIKGGLAVEDSNCMNNAKTQALLKLSGQKAGLAESLAEAKKTVNMLAAQATDVAIILRSIRRGNFKAAAQRMGLDLRTKKAAQRVLEWQYGWKPILSSVYDTIGILEKGLIASEPMIYGQATIPDQGRRKSYDSSFEGFITSRRHSRCRIDAVITNDYLRVANQGGFVNPALLAWELVPYSFLVDWVMPISDILDAFSASAGLRFVSGYTLTRVEYEAELTKPVGGSSSSTKRFELSRRGMDAQGFAYRRTPLGSFPRPVPYIVSPFENQGRILNAAALVRGLSRR